LEFSVHEDRIIAVPINKATAADHVLEAVGVGRLFLVFAVFLQTEGTVDVTFKSGTTAITGAIAMATAGLADFYWSNGGDPLWRGVAAGDDFIMTLSAAVQVNGWASLMKIDSRNK
jgi:hypothetical protein